jgi:hypothetical protein
MTNMLTSINENLLHFIEATNLIRKHSYLYIDYESLYVHEIVETISLHLFLTFDFQGIPLPLVIIWSTSKLISFAYYVGIDQGLFKYDSVAC